MQGQREADTTAKRRQRPLLQPAAGEDMPNPEKSGSSASKNFRTGWETSCLQSSGLVVNDLSNPSKIAITNWEIGGKKPANN